MSCFENKLGLQYFHQIFQHFKQQKSTKVHKLRSFYSSNLCLTVYYKRIARVVAVQLAGESLLNKYWSTVISVFLFLSEFQFQVGRMHHKPTGLKRCRSHALAAVCVNSNLLHGEQHFSLCHPNVLLHHELVSLLLKAQHKHPNRNLAKRCPSLL